MDPYEHLLTPYEQRLRDEVLYLHSLWHTGPPPPPPHHHPPSSIPNNRNHHRPSSFSPNSPRNLHVHNSTSFKKTNRNPHHTLNAARSSASSSSIPDPDPDWPIDDPSTPPASSGWIPFEDTHGHKLSAYTPKPSNIDESKLDMVRLQQNVMSICSDFYAKRADSDGEEDDEFFGDIGEQGIEESEEFKFFFSLFVENRDLRDFYEKNQNNGRFYCLVCGSVGKPGGKLFKDCHGLISHSNRILKTKRKRAHRAFGLAICRVLGWDITRLPAIVITGQPLSQSLANLGETLNCLKEDDTKKDVEDIDSGGCVTQENKVVDSVEGERKETGDNGDEALEPESRDVHLKRSSREVETGSEVNK